MIGSLALCLFVLLLTAIAVVIYGVMLAHRREK
jgi:hypothetical protein